MEQKNIFSTIAKLKERYAEDRESLERIEGEAEKARQLLEKAEYAKNPVTQELLSFFRKEVLYARRKLATDKTLVGDTNAQNLLWSIIESRMIFIKFVSQDFEGELKSMTDQLEGDLSE